VRRLLRVGQWMPLTAASLSKWGRLFACNNPPAEPEAFRLLAPQRGLFATESQKLRARESVCCAELPIGGRDFRAGRWSCQLVEKAHSRNCQTSTATPAKPGDLPSD
jgi:hypothetical protein